MSNKQKSLIAIALGCVLVALGAVGFRYSRSRMRTAAQVFQPNVEVLRTAREQWAAEDKRKGTNTVEPGTNRAGAFP
jgi:hypothetical protein